jgi:hypothetical protein
MSSVMAHTLYNVSKPGMVTATRSRDRGHEDTSVFESVVALEEANQREVSATRTERSRFRRP